jgi:hypothetical protein
MNDSENLGQRRLFVESQEEVIPWQDFGKPQNLHTVAMAGEVGPYMEVADRAERLIVLMNTLAHRNMLHGISVGGTAQEYRTNIIERYAAGTPYLLANSKNKAARLHDEVQNLFWRATGFEALRGAGILGRKQVSARSAKMYRDFESDYGSPKKHPELVKLRRTQEKFLPIDHPLREENRLAKYKQKSTGNQEEIAA